MLKSIVSRNNNEFITISSAVAKIINDMDLQVIMK